MKTCHIPLNSEQHRLQLSATGNPSISIFDTFISEEYYSHHVAKYHNNCIRIVDTQDLHSLRDVREKLYLDGASHDDILCVDKSAIEKVDCLLM